MRILFETLLTLQLLAVMLFVLVVLWEWAFERLLATLRVNRAFRKWLCSPEGGAFVRSMFKREKL